ncbi:MAG: ABC transporter ATP-binding protein [Patescibacteria group bacterium]|jgi:putative ABC transport system ATP-binding protein
MAEKPIIEITNLIKEFHVGGEPIRILKDVSVSIDRGKFVILFGPSGSGKSTLLHSMLGLEKPTSGSVRIEDAYFEKMNPNEIARFRLAKIGIVYQRPDWIRSINVMENVAFPLAIKGVSRSKRNQKALDLLKSFKLEHRAYFEPTELSGGQQQKVEIARALITDPSIIVADEPTGNLDTESAENAMNLFKRLNEEKGITIIMVTHNMEYVSYASQTIYMRDGVILSGTGQFKTASTEPETKNKVKTTA